MGQHHEILHMWRLYSFTWSFTGSFTWSFTPRSNHCVVDMPERSHTEGVVHLLPQCKKLAAVLRQDGMLAEFNRPNPSVGGLSENNSASNWGRVDLLVAFAPDHAGECSRKYQCVVSMSGRHTEEHWGRGDMFDDTPLAEAPDARVNHCVVCKPY